MTIYKTFGVKNLIEVYDKFSGTFRNQKKFEGIEMTMKKRNNDIYQNKISNKEFNKFL